MTSCWKACDRTTLLLSQPSEVATHVYLGATNQFMRNLDIVLIQFLDK